MNERPVRQPLWFWLLLPGVPCVFLLLMHFIDGRATLAQPWLHERADARFSAALTPPPDSADWTPVALPDVDRVSPTTISSTWYRFHVMRDSRPPDSRPWAIYVYAPRTNLAVFVNGAPIGDGGSMTPPIPLHRGPLYFEFPGALLHPGDNVIAVRSALQWPRTSMDALYVGPASVLAPVYQHAYRIKVGLVALTIVLACALCVVMAAMFVMRPRETVFGWLALTILAWVLHAGATTLPRALIVNRQLWSAAGIALLGWYVLFACIFVHRFLRRRHRLREGWLLAWGVACSAMMALAAVLGVDFTAFESWIWLPGVHAVSLYIIWQLASASRTVRDVDTRLLLIAACASELIGVRDFLVFAGIIPGEQSLYLNYTIGLELMVFGTILLRRFVGALHESETLTRDLELRVAQRTQALARNLIRLKDLERERALSAEREHIIAEVHAGLSGRLTRTLSQTGAAPAVDILHGLLDELRLIADSSTRANGDLAAVLNALRDRLTPRLELAGLRVAWQVLETPSLEEAGPQQMLQITRVVQEAITNILKHARARTLSVRARRIANTVAIEIADDGGGLCESQASGRGLPNMRYRAAQLGGTLEVESGAQGTIVRLIVPMKLPAAALRSA